MTLLRSMGYSGVRTDSAISCRDISRACVSCWSFDAKAHASSRISCRDSATSWLPEGFSNFLPIAGLTFRFRLLECGMEW